jgi:hypothetical protein
MDLTHEQLTAFVDLKAMPLNLMTESSFKGYEYYLILFDADESSSTAAHYQQLADKFENPHPECAVTGELSIEDVDFSLVQSKGPKINFIYVLNYEYTCDVSQMSATFVSKDAVKIQNQIDASATAG